MARILVIYHGNCADGFTAAWAARKKFGDEAEYFAGVYQTPPPDCTGRDVVLVDFSYKRDVMREIAKVARSVLVLDHHKSAAEDLYQETRTDEEFATIVRMDGSDKSCWTWEYFQSCRQMDEWEGIRKAIIYAYFDMNKSGAGIAWDFFNPGTPRPSLVNHVEDRDLWRFALDGTREIQAAIFSHGYSFENWDMLAGAHPHMLITEGTAIERKHHKDVAELVAVCKRRLSIGGHVVPVASLPYTLTGDAGHLMAQGEPFAACYWDTESGRVFSLRSTDGGMDVSAIAKLYGGGGHAQAAGFTVPRNHALAVA